MTVNLKFSNKINCKNGVNSLEIKISAKLDIVRSFFLLNVRLCSGFMLFNVLLLFQQWHQNLLPETLLNY